MPEIIINFDVEIWCDTCGAGLCNTVNIKGNDIYVPVCETCRDRAGIDGYNEGYKECEESLKEI